MARKLALKRLTKSDLTFFKWHFQNNNAGNQKAINLNGDVFVDHLFPALPDEAIPRSGRFPIDLFIYGPGNAPELNLQRKIVKFGRYKNWRLNGEFVDNPLDQPARFNTLAEDDFAIFEFNGLHYPEASKLYLVSAIADASLHRACEAMLGPRRMVALLPSVLDDLLREAGILDLFPIAGYAAETAVEDAALGGISGIGTLIKRNAVRPVTKGELREARNKNDQVGEAGEVLVNALLEGRVIEESIESFEWESLKNAIAPYDFSVVKAGSLGRIDVKTTTGGFEAPIHISTNELLHMAEGDEEYLIYRLYELVDHGAVLRISGPMKPFAQRVTAILRQLPSGVSPDGISLNPKLLSFGEEIQLSGPEVEE